MGAGENRPFSPGRHAMGVAAPFLEHSCFYRVGVASMQGGLSHEGNVCLSVCPSVRQTRAFKRKKLVPTFLHCMKDQSSLFYDKKNGWWGDSFLLPEILGQTDPVGAKTPIFYRRSLVASQP